jgi:putative hydrolase of the HAD superfamily
MPAKIIFFDAGGTLFRPWPSVGHVYARTALKHGVSVDPEIVEKAFHDKWHDRNGSTELTMVSPVGNGELSRTTSEKIEREWWYALVRDVFHNLEAFDNFDAFFTELYDLFAKAECWRLFEDTLPALDALKARGHRLGIISNWDYRLFSIVKQLGLDNYFETVIASAAVGCSKPGVKIFEAALTAMKVEPAACVHIGDSVADDYEGAQKSGLTPVLIDRSMRAYNGFTRMKSLTELPAFLS